MRLLLTAVLLCTSLLAQGSVFVAHGGHRGSPVECPPAAASGLDAVFLFNGMDNASVSFKCDNPNAWGITIYTSNSAVFPESGLQRAADGISLSGLAHGQGVLLSDGSATHAFYIVDYAALDFSYDALKPVTDAEDICSGLQLAVEGSLQDIAYQGTDGRTYEIKRRHTLSYTDQRWDASANAYVQEPKTVEREGFVSAFSLDAPLQNTTFVLEGDQFAAALETASAYVTADYSAVHVETHAAAEGQRREAADNEVGGDTDGLTGSAPFTVDFHSYVNAATDYCIWYIYTTPGSTDDYLYRNETDISHTFSQAGTFTVKLMASNAVCADSASFEITVTESMLDCPNFFSPRSTPGENDEFKVAYRSLTEFRGRILNRWGNVLFEWTDPALGWNGTYRGQAVSPGVYFYVITATGSDGIKYVRKGDINLLE